jgi:diguanylate cyclase (GGDEF)-like protein
LPLFGSRELVRTRATTLPFALDYGAEEAALLATSVDLAPLRHRSKILAFELFLAGVLPLLIASAGLMLVVRRAVLPELFHLAQTDSLSGVYNRRAFLETAASLLAKDQLLRKPCVLAILDVDRFKMINDTHGHGVGDEVIRHVSDLLLGMVRRTDVVGRLGGDEFALLLEASGPDARQRFEGIRLAVNAVPFGYPDSLCVPLALSIGMACSDGRAGYRLAALMEEADAALYAAKKQGRNQVVQLER